MAYQSLTVEELSAGFPYLALETTPNPRIRRKSVGVAAISCESIGQIDDIERLLDSSWKFDHQELVGVDGSGARR